MYTWANGDRYNGTYDEHNLPAGNGTFTAANGTTYTGMLRYTTE